MLLRLLPTPTPEQPAPPTILFTLPLPVSPYTSRALPLPPAFLNHRSLCVQEGIELSNILLGDKANWIAGVVDEVTFDTINGQITAHLIDATTFALPIEPDCSTLLAGVIRQVQLSFAPRPVAIQVPQPKRSPSGILYSLLSPLLAQQTQPAAPAPPANPSRLHRRQARSLLVDAYRRHVLPALKEKLPANYISWSTQSELNVRQADWDALNAEMDKILEASGWSSTPPARVNASAGSYGMCRIASSSSSSVASSWQGISSDEDDSPPTTPGTSIFVSSPSSSPLAHLAGLPAAAIIAPAYRLQYSNLISRMASLASRIANLKKLRVQMEREEGRKRWLISLEASRQLERATRRSWSNGTRKPLVTEAYQAFRPKKSSPLGRPEAPQHPVMSMDMDVDEFSPNIVVRPISPSECVTAFDGMTPPPLLPSLSSESVETEDPIMSPTAEKIEFLGSATQQPLVDHVWKISETEIDQDEATPLELALAQRRPSAGSLVDSKNAYNDFGVAIVASS